MSNTNTFAADVDTTTDMCVEVQNRALVTRESEPPKLLKVKQKADELMKRIWTDEDEEPEVKTSHQHAEAVLSPRESNRTRV